jgi:hypothetical protein
MWYCRPSIAVVIALIFSVALEGAGPETVAPTTARATQPAPATQPADYLDVAETVFRYQFDHNASGAQRHANYFFLTLEGPDPPVALMKRFASDKPQVLPGSVARTSKERGVEHRYRGGEGLIFRIGSITKIDDKSADVGQRPHLVDPVRAVSL